MGLYWVGNSLLNALVDGLGTELVSPNQEQSLATETLIFST